MTKTYEDIGFAFGSHAGKLVCDIPSDYLEWIYGEDWFKKKHSDLAEIVRQEIEYRKVWDIKI